MIAALIVLVLVFTAASTSAQTPPVPDAIVTTGEALVRRAPDVASITVSVETRANSPREAQRLNATAMTAMQQRIAELRLGPDAVRTLGYNVQPQFDFSGGKRVPRGYAAVNSVQIRIDDITRVGEVMDAVGQGGATTIGGLTFEVKDRAAVEREALRLAVADARARADAAAAGAGRAVDRVIKIEDAREPGVIAPRRMLMETASASAVDTPIEPGLIEIRARVTLTAAMR